MTSDRRRHRRRNSRPRSHNPLCESPSKGDMVDLIVLPAAAAAGSAADGLRHDDELIERGPASRPRRVAAAPRAGAVAAPALRETPRLWHGPARRLAAQRERRTLES